ncbi:E3 ubiquitin-protein ligase TRIM39-like [Perca flavescens]|uniref:E3 ubiquitin-protein ligase TRIM39-like n=1 Tax=Perca flavescens TaxID=8167 RepID=UPI00106DFBB8|nr:E3 ubiquitin-protein ligase TRIM39-like [Perca flavescens]
MASANISQSEDQFLCSICLDVFSEPVSTPCGHNYCKGCISGYWASSDFSQCPLCNETFQRAPELQVNTDFRDMLELFKRSRVAAGHDSGSPAGPGEVPCDLCHGMKRKAVKSCLNCLVSYCNAHLEPHRTVQAFKRHELISPVETLEDRLCKKHNKAMEFFCREDQSCVCFVCLREDHVTHKAVSLEEEFAERKTALKCAKRQVKHTVNEKCNMVTRIRSAMMQGRQEVDRTKAEMDKAFASLVASIETKKVKVLKLLEEKQKAAERQARELVQRLQLEIAEHSRTSAELEELSRTEDNFKLLRDLPSVPSPSNATHFKTRFTAEVRSLLQIETVKSAMAKIEDELNQQMENIVKEVNLVDEVETQMQTQAENVFDDELGKIQEQHATEVTLDRDTAHPSLIVSEDGKQVSDGGTKRNLPDNPTRFDTLHFVRGSEGFSSGKFYYEVTLKGQMGWEVGVVRESISHKGVEMSLSPESGCWTLGLYWGQLQANANPAVALPSIKELQKIGVFVDYEGALVSFYDVDTRALIYSFTGCAFTESATLLRSFIPFRAKTRIYPLFRPSAVKEGSALLQISPVKCAKRKVVI